MYVFEVERLLVSHPCPPTTFQLSRSTRDCARRVSSYGERFENWRAHDRVSAPPSSRWSGVGGPRPAQQPAGGLFSVDAPNGTQTTLPAPRPRLDSIAERFTLSARCARAAACRLAPSCKCCCPGRPRTAAPAPTSITHAHRAWPDGRSGVKRSDEQRATAPIPAAAAQVPAILTATAAVRRARR
eukprot:279761-Chlamydomonas_euryale.AAC.3